MTDLRDSIRLGDVLTLQRGFDLPKNDRKPGDVPLVSSSGISDFQADPKVMPPAVITGRYGTLGKVFYLEEPCFPLNTTLWVKDFKGNHPRFCKYLLETIDYYSCSDKGAVPGVNRNHLEQLLVRKPKFAEQEAIAHILGALDDKIELNQKMNETLEDIAKAIFKSWFVDFDPVRAKAEGRPTGLPAEISDLFPDAFEDSEIGEIPAGWSERNLYQFCSVEYGAPFKSKLFNEEGLGKPLVRIRDLPRGSSGVFTEEVHPKGRLIKAGDLVVGMDGEFRCYLWRGEDSWMNQRVCKFVPKEGVPVGFLWFSLERPLHFIESTEVATTVIHLGKSDIDDFKFMESSNQLLEKFDSLTRPILDKIILADQETAVLTELRDTLLPKLISGELRIPDAEKFLAEVGI